MTKADGEVFGAVVDVRNTELSVLWARFNIHLVVNGGFLAAYLAAGDHTGFESIPSWVVRGFGLWVAALWLWSECVGRKSLKHRDEKIKEFEDAYFKDELATFKVFRDRPGYLLDQSTV